MFGILRPGDADEYSTQRRVADGGLRLVSGRILCVTCGCTVEHGAQRVGKCPVWIDLLFSHELAMRLGDPRHDMPLAPLPPSGPVI